MLLSVWCIVGMFAYIITHTHTHRTHTMLQMKDQHAWADDAISVYCTSGDCDRAQWIHQVRVIYICYMCRCCMSRCACVAGKGRLLTAYVRQVADGTVRNSCTGNMWLRRSGIDVPTSPHRACVEGALCDVIWHMRVMHIYACRLWHCFCGHNVLQVMRVFGRNCGQW